VGYTIWYEGTSETPITPEQLAQAQEHAARWTTKLSESAEDYRWDIDDEDDCKISGWTKPGLDELEMEEDVDTLIDAVRTLDGEMDGLEFTVTDDYETEHYP